MRGSPMSTQFVIRFTLGVLFVVAAEGCARHVRLTTPATDPGARYVCRGEGECQPADVDVPSERNPSGTTAITLPRQCAGKIHQILVIDAGSSEPKVDVTCAPAEEPIETMGAPEAKN
jgi:hypothetical protein